MPLRTLVLSVLMVVGLSWLVIPYLTRIFAGWARSDTPSRKPPAPRSWRSPSSFAPVEPYSRAGFCDAECADEGAHVRGHCVRAVGDRGGTRAGVRSSRPMPGSRRLPRAGPSRTPIVDHYEVLSTGRRHRARQSPTSCLPRVTHKAPECRERAAQPPLHTQAARRPAGPERPRRTYAARPFEVGRACLVATDDVPRLANARSGSAPRAAASAGPVGPPRRFGAS